MRHGHPPPRGAALVTALCLMLALLMLAVSAAQMALDAARAARQGRDRQLALRAAEAALADAVRDIGGARGALLDDTEGGVAGRCPAAPGLCYAAPAESPPQWQRLDLAASGASAAYGEFTGRVLASGGPGQPVRPPRYLIEQLPASSPGASRAYRLTAIGFGAQAGTQVVLQAHYRSGGPGEGGALAGWREVMNWADLHAAARE